MSKIGIVVALLLLTAAALLPANGTYAAGNSIESVDTTGDVGASTSLALDPFGYPVVAYRDNTNIGLKLLHCGDATCTSGNSIIEVDAGVNDTVGAPSLAIDSSGIPWITNQTRPGLYRTLQFIHCNNPNCTAPTAWKYDDNNYVGGHDTGAVSSLQIDVDDIPVVTYTGTGGLRLARCLDTYCVTDTNNLVDASGGTPSLALDSANNPAIAYTHSLSGVLTLRMLRCDDEACAGDESGHIYTPAAGGFTGLSPSMAIDSSNNPVILYSHLDTEAMTFDDGELRLLHCDDPYCAGDESGNIVTLVSPYSIYNRHSLGLDQLGNPVISYFDESGDDLKLIRCGNPGCTGAITPIVLDTSGDVGRDSSLALGAGGVPVISYYDADPNYDLKVFRCGKLSCGYGNTPAGSNVIVQPSPEITATFTSVTATGDTSVTTSSSGPAEPSGFRLGTGSNATYYDITTTAAFSGTVKICITYDDSGINESNIKLFHRDGSNWVDITNSKANNPDTVNNKICGVTTSFSEFFVPELIPEEDYDGDGCPNGDEVGAFALLGGLRDAFNPHDYFNPSGDGKNRVDDILLIVQAYFDDDNDGNPGLPPYAPGYDPGKDRVLPLGAPYPWSLQAGNGQQRVDDILNSVKQYFHDCPTP